jgi:phosphate transport system protein
MEVSRVAFEEDLSSIHRDVLTMGTRVEEDLLKAVRALQTGDSELAGFVIADDSLVNALQIRIEDAAIMVIATRQPVARDLRELMAVMRLASDLERMGDYAVHLAKAAKRIRASDWPRQAEDLAMMGETGADMIRQSLSAFLERDVGKARACAVRDDLIDERYHRIIEESLAVMKAHPEKVETASRLMRASAFLERLGDHVTAVCELTIYLVEGFHEELNG